MDIAMHDLFRWKSNWRFLYTPVSPDCLQGTSVKDLNTWMTQFHSTYVLFWMMLNLLSATSTRWSPYFCLRHSTLLSSLLPIAPHSPQNSNPTPSSGHISSIQLVCWMVATSQLCHLPKWHRHSGFFVSKLPFRVRLWSPIHICPHRVGGVHVRCSSIQCRSLAPPKHSGWKILAWQSQSSVSTICTRPISWDTLPSGWMGPGKSRSAPPNTVGIALSFGGVINSTYPWLQNRPLGHVIWFAGCRDMANPKQ